MPQHKTEKQTENRNRRKKTEKEFYTNMLHLYHNVSMSREIRCPSHEIMSPNNVYKYQRDIGKYTSVLELSW